MLDYPLIFTFRELVTGRGFLAGLTVKGRALIVKEDDGFWWLYGVQPGGMAECGQTPDEAYHRFHAAFAKVLIDLSDESGTYGEFEAHLSRFVSETDSEDAARWEEARKAIRAGRIIPESPFSSLPRITDVSSSTLEVKQLDRTISRLSPQDNVEVEYARAA